MEGGYCGKMLLVDLTRKEIQEKEVTEDLARRFVGGYGLGARVLYDLIRPGVDPLGPENVIGFVTGPLNGTGAFMGGRYTVVCKSPVTHGWNDANSGGFFGPELKKAGYDAVFVTGAAETPVYLWIHDGKTEIRDASRLWGLDTTEALQALMEIHQDRLLRAALIGPAGEKLSLMACVMNERHRAAGRGGPGAVMGSKKLKAVVVRGTGKVPVADPERLKEINQSIRTAMKEGPLAQVVQGFAQFGTGMNTGANALSGDTPVKNWGGVGVIDFGEEKAHKLDSIHMDKKYRTRKYACANCVIGCGADYRVEEGPWPLPETFRPEYETAAAFGTLCLNDQVASILKCNDICNRYGLDTISVGGTIAWAIECYEKGLLSKKDTDGLELRWGNGEAIVALTQAIADQNGLGRILAQGSLAASKTLGKGAEYLQTAKGIELPMHDPRLSPGYARTYQIDPTPGRHVKGGTWQGQANRPNRYDFSNTGPIDVTMTCRIELINITGLCLFSGFVGIRDLAPRLLAAVTGWEVNDAFVNETGRRVFTMRHVFNLREGQKPTDVILPARSVGEPPQTEGPLKGVTIDHRALAQNFFKAMDWDGDTGRPSRHALESLGGLEDVIRDLYR